MIVVGQIVGKVNGEARRAVAQSIVDERYGCKIVRDHFGAPSLADGAAFISISHTEHYVAVAFDDKQVGVDIELVQRRVEHLASRFASSAEMAVCRAVFEQNPALLVWCAKEAIYKTLHRQGVDFLHDMVIRSATSDRITAIGDKRQIELEWEIKDKLLIVCTI